MKNKRINAQIKYLLCQPEYAFLWCLYFYCSILAPTTAMLANITTKYLSEVIRAILRDEDWRKQRVDASFPCSLVIFIESIKFVHGDLLTESYEQRLSFLLKYPYWFKTGKRTDKNRDELLASVKQVMNGPLKIFFFKNISPALAIEVF